MPSIAIIGTGISAMGAAYFLRDQYDICFYEKENYAGGHTHTLTIPEGEQNIYIDTAFMVYNEITYPNLTRLFKELDVQTKNTDMSFSVQHKPSGLEYCGTGFNGLFAQRRNLLSLSHWKLLLELDRFNKESIRILDEDKASTWTLKEYVKKEKYSDDFVQKFLIPISSAVWSTPPDLMLEFPAVTLIQFFKNHGFLGLHGHYQWKTVVEGSQRYRDKILANFKGKVFLNKAAVKVIRQAHQAIVVDSTGEKKEYDKVILACHAPEALDILQDPTPLENDLLSRFPYYENRVTLHTDQSVMPQKRLAWSSWNYRIDRHLPTTIYWMNNLQQVSDKKNYFISINDQGDVDQSKIIWESYNAHPLFDPRSIQAQEQLQALNKNGVLYFCGAYFKYGFHEDGLNSGIKVAEAITGQSIWN